MDLNVLELITGEEGLPQLDRSSVEFRSGDHALIGGMPRISSHENSRWLVFVELAPGFLSDARFADADQMVVCLSGKLSVSLNDGQTQNLVPGDVVRLRKAVSSTHVLSVVGDIPVHLMVVQLKP